MVLLLILVCGGSQRVLAARAKGKLSATRKKPAETLTAPHVRFSFQNSPRPSKKFGRAGFATRAKPQSCRLQGEARGVGRFEGRESERRGGGLVGSAGQGGISGFSVPDKAIVIMNGLSIMVMLKAS